MKAKKWLVSFAVILIVILLLIAGLNVAVDPFGVFGDPIFNWYSYDFTNNPRAAKIAYLEKNNNHEKYDSYVVGASATSSFPTEELNDYLDASFFNMIMYGADMRDVEETCYYLIDSYEVKNLVVNFSIANATKYNYENNSRTDNMDWRTNGENPVTFYGRYAFSNPQYSFSKINAKKSDTFLSQSFDVFDVETGAYDKRARDVEAIGSLEDYLEAYPIFTDYPEEERGVIYEKETVDGLLRIKQKCEQAGVNLIMVSSPMYADYFSWFKYDDISRFYREVSNQLEFWDFAMSSVSHDPRFFYDEGHFRNAVGTMAVGKIFDDSSVYMPDDFGFYVTEETVDEYLERFKEISKKPEIDYTADVPILMYHHLTEEADDESRDEIKPESFEAHMSWLKENGYTAVFLDEMIDFVNGEGELPEKPVCITFDDGYLSNYEPAFPIIKKYDMKATVFAIGFSVGAEKYKETDFDITPHFDFAQAKEMVDSGYISVQTHAYDMHSWEPFEEEEKFRSNMGRQESENENDYIEAIRDDIRRAKEELEVATGEEIYALAYPYGVYDSLSEVIVAEEGIATTLSIRSGTQTLVKGLPQSLRAMKRYYVGEYFDMPSIE